MIGTRTRWVGRLILCFWIGVAYGCGSGGGDKQTKPTACSVSATQLDFGSVTVGQTKDLLFTITNTGQGTLSGTATESCADYSLQGNSSYSLGSGASAAITVRFAPTVSGTHPCTVSSGAGCPAVPLTGVGVSTGCQVAPAALNFGAVAVGTSADRTFTVTNTGTTTRVGTVISPCADFPIQGSASYNLGPGALATITVRFAPSVGGVANCLIETGDALCADVSCSATGLDLSSGLLVPGATYQHTFAAAGIYPYHCEIHSVMRATVIVDPASVVMSASVNIANPTASGFSPSSLTVGPGGTVTWTNQDAVTHTVTSD